MFSIRGTNREKLYGAALPIELTDPRTFSFQVTKEFFNPEPDPESLRGCSTD